MEKVLFLAKNLIPKKLFSALQPAYHYAFALIGAVLFRFPSRKIKVVAVTGTKGKTSTAEIVSAILEEAGNKTALAGTLRFKIGPKSRPNLYKMTMPGRIFIQRFLRQAVKEGCQWAVLEMTSEGARQFRHAFINLDALIFTNLAPEHIESHGSYEKYLAAKLSLAKALEKSPKRPRAIIANADDKEGTKFLSAKVESCLPFSLNNAKLFSLKSDGLEMMFKGLQIRSHLRGVFNIQNILAAATFADSQGIETETIKKAVENISEIKGRVEEVNEGQSFKVIVDYAHTPDSLKALYEAFPGEKRVCVLGSTGGGRDTWKRPAMGKIADEYCEEIILTDEDSYDENPQKIVEEITKGIEKHFPKIIMDRREAIREALRSANQNNNSVVLITGKGTDPFIMGPNGSKIKWSDEKVAREELRELKM